MRTIVCGGRDFADAEMLCRVLDEMHALFGFEVVIHGAARGADFLAGYWAQRRGVWERRVPADWATHGRRAGPLRNFKMLRDEKPGMVVAFPGGRGTAHMVEISIAAGVPTAIVDEKGAWGFVNLVPKKKEGAPEGPLKIAG